MSNSDQHDALEGVAVIGMSGRFPGAQSVDEFWRNLRDGVESIFHFSAAELKHVDPALVESQNYVKAAGVLKDIELFDAQFFGFTPREAEMMDPQHRLFLECAWEALESAGYDSETYNGLIGTYAGMAMSKYLLNNLLPHPELIEAIGPLQLKILNDKDFLTSLLAYEMNLKGPSVTVQTACSTSLVAVCLACQSLLSYQCDIAISGGVCIEVPHHAGYFHVEGVTSPDGHCNAFDANAHGTVQGNGVGVVVLKRLSEALADGDTIHAVIKGSATNNDGAAKVGFTATSVDGQMDVVALAQAVANVEADTIGYIEAHGTATPLGDPIEVAALTQIFRESTQRNNFCALGSVKTNIGHLDAAAGVAGLIKTVLALKHAEIPPSINFKEPNPHIDFANSPFYVNTQLTEWKRNGTPRRAGVSSFSLGGVNAHVVLEEPPVVESEHSQRTSQLLVLSAKTEAALETATDNLVAFLKQRPEQNLADVVYTYQVGRRSFSHRRTLVCDSVLDAATALETRDPRRVLTSVRETQNRAVTFMFPGLGNHYVNMARGLYQDEPGFRVEVDRCCEILKPHLGLDLRYVLYPKGKDQLNAVSQKTGVDLRKMLRRDGGPDEATSKLDETWLSQPALFVIEYALAQWWMKCGIRPQAMIGYSIGEHVAACLSGVFSLEDALWLVAKRAQLIQELPAGAMLAVPLAEKEVQPLLSDQLSLAAINGPAVCVLAGVPEAINELEEKLSKRGIACRRPQTTHAFHSRMMKPVAGPFNELMKQVKLNAPEIPYLSNVTGTWITAEHATDPTYWGRHLCETVRFADGIQSLWQTPERILLEVGPGNALGAWAMQQSDDEAKAAQPLVLSSLRHSYDCQQDEAFLLNTLGKLWLAGVPVQWRNLYEDERRRLVPLPTYPFERRRYWVEPQRSTSQAVAPQTVLDVNKKTDIADWFYLPSWKQTRLPHLWTVNDAKQVWLLFLDECGVGARMTQRLRNAGHEVLTVSIGEQFERHDESSFTLNPQLLGDYRTLFEEIFMSGKAPGVIAHLWNVTHPGESTFESEERQYQGFYSLLFIAQVLGDQNYTDKLRLGVISNGIQTITGDEDLCPEKATLIGPCKVIPREYPHITAQSIDIATPVHGSARADKLSDLLISELTSEESETVVAYRGVQRWKQDYEATRLNPIDGEQVRLRDEGVYLITGGTGGIGLTLAETLARNVRAKLVLIGRSPLPVREEWQSWLASHDAQETTSIKLRKIQQIESLGAEVLYMCADVTDEAQMRGVIVEALAHFGSVHGVIHAAGVLPGGLIQMKTPEAAAAVLAPKLKGTLVLGKVLKDLPLDFFVLCSSLTAILGSFGMVDHCAANAFLDAYAQHNAATDGPFTTSINWDTWLEVGQAAETSAPLAQRSSVQREVAHPLHDKLLSETADEDVFATSFDSTRHWILNEHRMMGSGMIPGTAYLEMARAAFAKRASGTIQIEKVLFMTPFVVRDGESNEVRTAIRKNGDVFDFVIESNASSRGVSVEHVRGKVSDLGYESATQFDLESILARCNKEELNFGKRSANSQSDNPHEQHMSFGPRWQGLLKRVHLGEQEWLAYLEIADEFLDDLDSYVLHPALLDASVGVVQLIGKGSYLPLGYESLKVNAPLRQRVYSHITPKDDSANGALLTCDVVIMDEDGVALVEIEGYSLKRLEAETVKALSDMSNAAQVASETKDEPQVASTPKSILQELKEGMLPFEGAEVFRRVLAASLLEPQVITSTKDIRVVMERVNKFTSAHIMREVDQLQTHTVKYPRPNIQNPYVEPRNDLERDLAAIWQDMLGIEEVGCFDNFFELGGDSLLATKLIGRLAESFHVDLPLRTLFEAPTVSGLAVVIVQNQAELTNSELLAQILSEIKDLPETEVQTDF